MAAEPALRPDRRARRRQETIDEVVDVALEVMAEQGAAGLSLGEVARRMGIRPPSLYVYFASKNALYDAIFMRGWMQLQEALDPLWRRLMDGADPAALLLESNRIFVRWSIENQASAQLMFWRPVPGYEPSAEAYAPAVANMELASKFMAELQRRGALRPDVALDEALRAWTALVAGVTSQQLANAPHESFDEGTFTALLPVLTEMYLTHYGPRPKAHPV